MRAGASGSWAPRFVSRARALVAGWPFCRPGGGRRRARERIQEQSPVCQIHVITLKIDRRLRCGGPDRIAWRCVGRDGSRLLAGSQGRRQAGGRPGARRGEKRQHAKQSRSDHRGAAGAEIKERRGSRHHKPLLRLSRGGLSSAGPLRRQRRETPLLQDLAAAYRPPATTGVAHMVVASSAPVKRIAAVPRFGAK